MNMRHEMSPDLLNADPEFVYPEKSAYVIKA